MAKDQSAFDGMPDYPTTVAVVGNLLFDATLDVDEAHILEVEVTIRKAGLAHQAEGEPKPYATAQITGVSTPGWRKARPAEAKINE